jgi:hypothetical protein
LRFEQFRACLLERVERPSLGDRQQLQSRVRRAGLMLRHRRFQRATSATLRVRRQLGGFVEEGRGSGEAPTRTGTIGGPLKLPSDLLVERRRRMRAMPGASVGIDLRISEFDKRAVRQPPCLRSSGAVHG